MTFEEMAWEFIEVFDELDVSQTNELLAKNVPIETLEFFGKYAQAFGEGIDAPRETTDRLPNLLLIGYLLRVLEQRLHVYDSVEP
jgi:hypothetical protein